MAICFLSLAAFLVLASVAKLRPNLDEEVPALEKLQKLVSTQRSGDALSIEPPIIEEPSCSPPPARPIGASVRSEGACTCSLPASHMI
jgi:hypothetical protein